MGISAFGYKEKHTIHVSKKCCKEKHVDLLLTVEGKRQYLPIKDFDSFMYDHTLNHGKKYFCHYCLQAFSTKEILKSYIKDCFKFNEKQRIIIPKKGKYVKFKNNEIKIKSRVITYVDFESILLPEINGKQNSKEFYISKYQKHIAGSYGF